MSRTLLTKISNIKRGLIGQVYQGCQRHQPKTSRDFLGTNYRQLETFIMTPSIFMVMKKEMNFPVAFKLKAFIYHNFLSFTNGEQWRVSLMAKKLKVRKQTSS